MPIVTTVIPTFGRPELLKRAIKSALDQTVRDIEIIVVIDGQDPPTFAMLDGLNEPRLRYIAHEAKKGAGATRNTGALAAKGEWIAFLDDDDEWLPTKLEEQLAVAPREPAIIMTLSNVVTPEGTFVRPAKAYDGRQPVDEWIFDRTTWLKGGLNFLQTSSLMVPRKLFDVLRFGEAPHEDWELSIRAVKEHGHALVTAKAPLVVHYVGQPRPSLSKTYGWKRSLEWSEAVGKLLTPRALSGFLLTTAGQSAANNGDYSAFWPLLKVSFQKGAPTAKQLFRYVMCFAIPRNLRRQARAKLQGVATANPQQ